MFACYLFMYCPTDPSSNSQDCSKAPGIVNTGWNIPSDTNLATYKFLIDSWRAVGIIPILPIGTPIVSRCGSTFAPGNFATVISVGSTYEDDPLHSQSVRGPALDGSVQPDLVAPGGKIMVLSYSSDTDVKAISGAYVGASRVAGAVALMLSARPYLDFDQVKSVLTSTAVTSVVGSAFTCGLPSDNQIPNNMFGYGRLGALVAVKKALRFTLADRCTPLSEALCGAFLCSSWIFLVASSRVPTFPYSSHILFKCIYTEWALPFPVSVVLITPPTIPRPPIPLFYPLNPGPGGAGAVIIHLNQNRHATSMTWAASMTYANKATANNVAEYRGLLIGLHHTCNHALKPLHIIGDSAMVITQRRIHKSPTNPRLATLHQAAKALADVLGVHSWSHHYREYNKMAGCAANVAMDTHHSQQVKVPSARPLIEQVAQHLHSDVEHWVTQTQDQLEQRNPITRRPRSSPKEQAITIRGFRRRLGITTPPAP